MLIFKEIKPDLVPSSCLALGMFDGVHLGHQKVILDAVKKAKSIDAISTVVTFANHPQRITAKTPTKLITTLDDRLDLFRELDIQATVILDFTEEFSKISADDYIKNILTEGLNAKSISIGYDHRFGADKKGDSKLLEKYSSEYGYEVSIIPPVIVEGQVASSSDIRKFISNGDVYLASKLLGRPFSIKGTVIMGQQRGRQLGFPTANVALTENLVAPATGVYSGLVYIDGKSYYSVINLGKRPTFGDISESIIEAHVLNYSGDLYHKTIEISFLKRLREEKPFSSASELIEQIKIDCQMATTSIASL